MNETPENPDELESVTDQGPESFDTTVSVQPLQAESEPEQARPPWQRVALMVGGGLVIAAAAVVATLAATYRSAVQETERAYDKGLSDGYAEYASEFGDAEDEDEDDYCENCDGIEGMGYCPECDRVMD